MSMLDFIQTRWATIGSGIFVGLVSFSKQVATQREGMGIKPRWGAWIAEGVCCGLITSAIVLGLKDISATFYPNTEPLSEGAAILIGCIIGIVGLKSIEMFANRFLDKFSDKK